MKPGRASRTSEIVCEGRAIANARGDIDDPTALALLPEGARRRVLRAIQGERPRSLLERVRRFVVGRHAATMTARTLEIDRAVREAAAPQLVILGAGLDGRAYRMRELADATVFEVDHPDTQRDKRERVAGLTLAAREVRFVPVDFEKDALDARLAEAGHDPARPTTWVWEGVVMYLRREDVEATTAIVSRLSAAGSRLVMNYHAPTPFATLAAPFFRALGEPLRSSFDPADLRAMLAREGLRVVTDRSIREIGRDLRLAVARDTAPVHHLRIAVAERVGAP